MKRAGISSLVLATGTLIYKSFPKIGVFEFEVVTVNGRGEEIKRKKNKAKYFRENLGNGVTLDMVAVPNGTFIMGSQHQVKVPAFYMGKFEVTQRQWREVASLSKVSRDLEAASSYANNDRPVVNVSWYDAVEFCARLSQHTGREYRLPNEAEWEYACRARTTTPFNFGETITRKLANYRSGGTTRVGSFPPNAFGLYDMHGNVWEWCADDWDDYKVIRGGSWRVVSDLCRSDYRSNVSRVNHINSIGFRVVCVAPRTIEPIWDLIQ